LNKQDVDARDKRGHDEASCIGHDAVVLSKLSCALVQTEIVEDVLHLRMMPLQSPRFALNHSIGGCRFATKTAMSDARQ
jgi:hypothetical protein